MINATTIRAAAIGAASAVAIVGFLIVWGSAKFWTWWFAQSNDVKGALYGAAATLVVGVIGFIAVVVQIGRQARHAVEQNKLNEAAKLKLEIYRAILETCDAANEASLELNACLRTIALELRNANFMAGLRLPHTVPSSRFLEFSAKRQRAGIAAVGVITVVERWHVIDTRMSIFPDAVNAAIFDLTSVLNPTFDQVLMTLLPMQKPGSSETLPWTPVGNDAEQELRDLMEPAFAALSTLDGYVSDFQTEMQALLVGDLFSGQVEVRQPLDPQAKVIRLADEKALKRFFREESPWGKQTRALMNEVAAQYAMPAGLTDFGRQLWKKQAKGAAGALRDLGIKR